MPKYKRTVNLSKIQLKRRFCNKPLQLVSRQLNIEINHNDVSGTSDRYIDCSSNSNYICSDENGSNISNHNNNHNHNEEIDSKNFLISWNKQFNINCYALTALLKYLKKTVFPELPSDSRTLLNTPRKITIIPMAPGNYVHIGLRSPLNLILSQCTNTIKEIVLDFNIDGLPISKSSNSSFWLILGRACNLPDSSIFIIGIYHGFNKPGNFNSFLRRHVDDIKDLQKEYMYNGRIIEIKIRAYICDAPARSAILGTKGHNGYFGCSKCSQEGHFTNGRMTFPENDALLRTNESFRNRMDDNHHKTNSILEELNIDMIRQFPLDYLHTVCLGVVKKLVKIWLSGKPPFLLPSVVIKNISAKLMKISGTQPVEFQRRIRQLSDFGHFKGSELRTFLLYGGVFALNNEISSDKYYHFLQLHCAIFILCDKEKYLTHSDLAVNLLKSFVKNFGKLYGDHHLVYNVHCLTHLVEDTNFLGSLDNFSAFIFENFMSQVKRYVHTGKAPLQQIYNRTIEHNRTHNVKNKASSAAVKLKKKRILHSDSSNSKKYIYKEIILQNFKINDNVRNKWFLTRTKNIICFRYAEKIGDEIFISGNEILNKADFYTSPIASSALNIYATNGLMSSLKLWNIKNIYKKLFSMKTEENNSIVFMPLIHSEN